MFKELYHRIIPEEWRYWLYKWRNPEEIADLRTRVNPSPKGNFALRPFDEKQAIFVHITKTAGTSVALALFNALPYHYRAWQYRVIFGRKTFAQYYKFAFVRNPWDRLYSAFSYLKGGGWDDNDKKWAAENLADINDFNDFVMNWLTPERLHAHLHFWPQSEFICNAKDKPLIDYLAYFETINDDFNHIAKRIKTDVQLTHTNASKRAGYQSVYSDEAIAKVAELYARDIHNFGYSFDGVERKKVEQGAFVRDSGQ
ncbi:sulfotransferase family 2 domain-containing protein [Alteromonas sp. ASW11-36]|uniref:Sulfotransferase family 2 domain-containing protein n=1 Tax=Alteromonas arenosi TaxID=3055817 RepID=A0ABT7SVQ9_9ALTE|nr:sulfotransferase family 2 domain-containing protein [Alteromonas sp. ASW11-36]MDM7859634.1 sulfotransferase family 2 domain-containing protein [Alteromonas sp. ASW11-36]